MSIKYASDPTVAANQKDALDKDPHLKKYIKNAYDGAGKGDRTRPVTNKYYDNWDLIKWNSKKSKKKKGK